MKRAINAARISGLTRGPTRSWRNGDAQCWQLSNIADPFSDLFPSKKRPNLVSENHWDCRASARSCSLSARTHTSLSRSLSLRLLRSAHTHPLSLSLSLSASAPFSARTTSLSLSLSLRLLRSAHTHLSLSLSLSLRLLRQRAHTSLSLSPLSLRLLRSAHTHLSLSLSLSLRLLRSARAHLSLSLSLSLCVCSVQRAHTSLSLSLSLCVCSACGRERSSALIQLNRYYVASLILHASIAEITAQLLSLSYVYLISSDDGAIIMIFVQMNILEGSWLCSLNGSRFSHYFIFIPVSDNRNSKIYQFYWEFSFIKIQYVGKDRETNVIINNKCTFCCCHVQKKSCPVCKNVNRFVSVNCSVQRKRSNGNLEFIYYIYDLWNMSTLHALCWLWFQ